jgi:tetratricopeptide (TPR) repeat protein
VLALLSACSGAQAPAQVLDANQLMARLAKEYPLPEAFEPCIQKATAQWAALADREQTLLARYRRGPDAKTLLEMGSVYSQAEKCNLALACLTAAAGEPRLANEAMAWAAVNRLTENQLEEARLLAEQALKNDKTQGVAAAVLARVSLKLGDEARALGELLAACELLPADADLALEAARLLEEKQNHDLVARVLERPLRRDPLHPALLFRLARAREAQGLTLEAEALRQRHERAVLIDDLGLRQAAQPPDVVACALGVHFDEQGQAAKAYPEFQWARANTRDPKVMATSLAGVAHSGAQIGEHAEAQRARSELITLAPDHPMLPQIDAAFKKFGL